MGMISGVDGASELGRLPAEEKKCRKWETRELADATTRFCSLMTAADDHEISMNRRLSRLRSINVSVVLDEKTLRSTTEENCDLNAKNFSPAMRYQF